MGALTEKQMKVIDAARFDLQNYPWFVGVCLDRIPTDEEIDQDFHKAVEAVVMDTMDYDA